MIAYKVLNVDLCSAIAKKEAQVQYKAGIVVHAPRFLSKHGYDLTVFDTLEHAKAFANRAGDEIWEVEAFWTRKPDRVSFLINSTNKNYVARWARQRQNIPHYAKFEDYWPPGTMFAKSVKLVRRVR